MVCSMFGCTSLRYEVDLAADVLAVTLHVTNPGEEAFDFQVNIKRGTSYILYTCVLAVCLDGKDLTDTLLDHPRANLARLYLLVSHG